MKRTVFVLGAGFTRAFVPGMPLVLDRDLVPLLRRRARALQGARGVIEAEIRMAGGDAVNIERLMTRLDSGVPYDDEGLVKAELRVLLAEVKSQFTRNIQRAKKPFPHPVLAELAKCMIQKRIQTITFNYDDVLDEHLHRVTVPNFRPDWAKQDFEWDPRSEYGIPIQPLEFFEALPRQAMVPVLKLHGSVNWRVRRGFTAPYPLAALALVQDWFPNWTEDERASRVVPDSVIEREPLIVPPILLKSELAVQPVFKVIWAQAYEMLRAAGEVFIVGYSLPPTDFAVQSLLSEALSPDTQVTVVNLQGGKERQELERRFGSVCPGRVEFRTLDASEWAVDFINDRMNRTSAYLP